MIKLRAGIVLIENEKILLIHHNLSIRMYKPHYKNSNVIKDYWVFPGGEVLHGETLEACAKRETLEETGIVVEIGPLLFFGETIWPDGNRHIVNFFFAAKRINGEVIKPKQPLPDEKFDMPSFVPLSKINEITLLPDIKTYIKRIYEGEKFRRVYLKNMWKDIST
ncbi:NUDIX domain-containing protein [Thermovenabulum gondwanense]|uniref:Nudix hydrolase domain-containing protein n=1 Tax=Thermovenabulum gondwanense TaxID=520767 RepID=A0A162MEV4_9FIRM|nr:NUDIX hydrolase [Thermovenabulum gondwanense]KYO65509.1 hypothetical protein ATZ99_15450 [Thermovenabulum gondwanense]